MASNSSSFSNSQKLLEQLRANYLNGLASRFDDIELLILSLRSQDSYQELFREIHSLKGSSGTYGYVSLGSICHQFEDFLSSDKKLNDNNEYIDTCLRYLDLMRSFLSFNDKESDVSSELVNSLKNIRESFKDKLFYVLVVDSSKSLPVYIQNCLQHLPLRFTVVANGLQGLEKLLLGNFDLVITNYELDLLNGLAMLEANRLSGRKSSGTKTVLLTSKQDIVAAYADDIDRIIMKDAKMIDSLVVYINNDIIERHEL